MYDYSLEFYYTTSSNLAVLAAGLFHITIANCILETWGHWMTARSTQDRILGLLAIVLSFSRQLMVSQVCNKHQVAQLSSLIVLPIVFYYGSDFNQVFTCSFHDSAVDFLGVESSMAQQFLQADSRAVFSKLLMFSTYNTALHRRVRRRKKNEGHSISQ